MSKRAAPDRAVRAWLSLPERIAKSVRGLPNRALDLRSGSENWSIRETIHHLVEANLVASNIVISALARNGSTYDWTWVNPDASWMERVGYTKAPVRPALSLLRALGRHIAALLASAEDGLQREVRLFDAPRSPAYTKTVAEILEDELEHAREHLGEVAATLAAYRRRRRAPRR